ncbi:MAG: DEAD/DEAH box helicase, partial [Roseivirga sp.]|nr:DEAD/DEAH box helicase [Roseivirga sp.]
MTEPFHSLDRRIQKWIFKQGWTGLRQIQNDAIPPILAGNQDVIISASTAAGKTEAFFLPACSSTIDEKDGYSILYISPLKALINDQYRRLESLSIITDINVTPWHGDVAQSLKTKSKRNPSGIVLITPESLESLLIRNSGWVQR